MNVRRVDIHRLEIILSKIINYFAPSKLCFLLSNKNTIFAVAEIGDIPIVRIGQKFLII